MGNSIGGRKKAKVMKIDGETLKFKTPVRAWEVLKDCPGHVLLESEAVKRYGIRAKPLEPEQQLIPKKIYFLVDQLPKPSDEKVPRAVRSQSAGIHMSAKDRLECLMLSRRTVSDLSINRAPSVVSDGSGRLKVKIRLPSDQMAKLVAESRDGAEVAEKILELYRDHAGEINGNVPEGTEDALMHREAPWKPALGSIGEKAKAHKKRVSFVPMEEESCLDGPLSSCRLNQRIE
ncbi:hypothetical protein I3760_04G044800 [Carya illinoinensis]|uniref:Uncharacterized protein n=1 Tax=Carya illinoinensis TaxID=32201 RepID=A0A922FAQ4_CARIL|nr:hypothetical protein I3760_04G044800 [Carya illinoinensis]KAG6716385.1 hypothetical protein I3842_04G046100 [Carya illinoinensis]